MDVVFRTVRGWPWPRLRAVVFSRPAELYLAGLLSGVIAACGLLQHQAHWGSSGPMDRGRAAAIILGLFAGNFVQRRWRLGWPVWLMLSASGALILPWWLDGVVRLATRLPAELAAGSAGLEAIGWIAALASLAVPLACLGALACDVMRTAPPGLPTWFGAGVASGLLFNALGLSPVLGAEVATIACSVMAFAVSYRGWSRAEDDVGRTDEGSRGLSLLALLTLIGSGGALALAHRLSSQWAPQSVYLNQGAGAVIVAGVVLGQAVSIRRAGQRLLPWALLLIAAGLSLVFVGFESAVQISLWAAAYVTRPTFHQAALLGLSAAALLPIASAAGLALGQLRTKRFAAGLAAVFIGMFVLREAAVAMAPESLAAVAIGGVSVLAMIEFVAGGVRRWANRPARLVFAACLACGFAAPFLPAPNPTLTAKLLFSTQTFLAYRAGWNTRLLSQLDDARLIAEAPSRHGPLTVWKSRGADLLLREAGVPRSAIACRPEISPQLPSEVLQTVFALSIAPQPRRVLLLGASGGVPLSTCLSFPVQEIVCVESEAGRIELISGPIAAQRGFDPLHDDRVRLDRRPVELAAMMSDGGYDVIVSSPPSSSVASAAPQFTREFYRHIAKKLSSDGVFCQRFEAIDYGPLPFQLVAQTLLASFEDVVAVEIGVGEYLFLATNSDRGLAPADLAQELEKQHVRRVLARCGMDWSTLLTLGAWDREALAEISAEGTSRPNTAANCRLAFVGPQEMLRWGPKLHEMHELLTRPREHTVVEAPSPPRARGLGRGGRALQADSADSERISSSRRQRFLDWLGEEVASKDLLRRLSEVAAHSKIVQDGPDSFWLDYRKTLREELQQRPRTEIRQVAHTDETERVLHPEDKRRKEYFSALGAASDFERKSLPAVRALADYFEPYDPLVSLFARQEMAELLALYGHPDPAEELALRLHVIHFAPAGDRSLRNILAAAELLLNRPEAVPDPQDRFDTLNGLLQTLRVRWEVRSASRVKSARLAIGDLDRSIVVVQAIVDALDELAPQVTISPEEWRIRQEVIDRVLLRPLRGFRGDLFPRYEQSKAAVEAVRGKK
jgi:hypothetical protein